MSDVGLSTKIFLDSGDPEETIEFTEPCEDTRRALKHCGFLNGQTTNPSLVARNPEAKSRIEHGDLFTKEELFTLYKEIIQEISSLIPNGSVSIEVYADSLSTAEDMMKQAREMNTWIDNAHIKLPIIPEGLKAARQAIDEGMRVNMTLCFTQQQAAAVYSATKGAKKGDVFVSPFVGRLDDRGENGIDIVKNIRDMYQSGDGHVEVLSASIRTLNHFMGALDVSSDIITAPSSVLQEWAENGMQTPDDTFHYDSSDLQSISYEQIDLDQSFDTYDISHPKTDEGLTKFANDWNNLIVDAR